MDINDDLQIPDGEFAWSFARSSGPGGQNVNKVASKAILRWDLKQNTSVPDDVKERLRRQQKRRITTDNVMIVISQRYRDQERNRKDCLEKLRQALLKATTVPKPRKRWKPTRAAKEARLKAKRHRSRTKDLRRPPREE